jgi:hypothetical protein
MELLHYELGFPLHVTFQVLMSYVMIDNKVARWQWGLGLLDQVQKGCISGGRKDNANNWSKSFHSGCFVES